MYSWVYSVAVSAIKKSRTVLVGYPRSMLAMVCPVPAREAGLTVKPLLKLNRPKALCPGGLAVSLVSRRRKSIPNFKLCELLIQVKFAMYSVMFWKRIKGLERALPKPE